MAERWSTAAERKRHVNRLIAYHGPISKTLTDARTSLESRLIPVTAYIVVACAEAFFRYPDMVRRIDAAMPAEDIGHRGRRPGVQVNTVYLWSIVNFWLLGRKIVQQLDPSRDDLDDAATVLDFWERTAMAFRGDDGTRQAWDSGGVVRPYADDVVAELTDGAVPVDDDLRDRFKRFNATLVAHLFLMYFDTRVGTGNAGPWLLSDGRTLLVRDYYRAGASDFPWSKVAADVPYTNLTAGLVLDGDVSVRVTDFGSADTVPEDYLDHLVGLSLFTTDGAAPGPERPLERASGSLRPVPLDELDAIVAAVRKAQAAQYRAVAAMSRDEKIRCGAYVYFSFLKPFADEASIGDALDWTVPRDLPPDVYAFLSAMEGENAPSPDDGVPYYATF